MDRLLRALLCAAALAPASLATAQVEEADELPLATDGDGGEPADPIEEADPSNDPATPAGGGGAQTGGAATTGGTQPEGREPGQATTHVVVDERQAEMQREQAAMQDESAVEERDPTQDDEDNELSHLYQVGIRAGIGVPFFFGIRYGSGPRCSSDGDTFCFFLDSGFVDLDLSFGVTEDLEITALGRIGVVGSQPTDENRLLFGLGIRSLLMPRDVVKLFLGARVIIDVTAQGSTMPPVVDWGPVDFGVRGEFGLQVDVLRYLGIYAQIGVNVLFLRSFGLTGDAQAGLQARFP